jgi:Uma2 family endonuclease
MTLLEPSTRHGQKRRRMTVDEYFAMAKAGILAPDERVELIDGEIVEMSPKGTPHSIVAREIGRQLYLHEAGTIDVYIEATLRLSESDACDPDIMVVPFGMHLGDVRGEDTLMVVAISDSSIGYDLGLKSVLYARHGVPEYWVVDILGRQVHVHRNPGAAGFGSLVVVSMAEGIEPRFIPGFVPSFERALRELG